MGHGNVPQGQRTSWKRDEETFQVEFLMKIEFRKDLRRDNMKRDFFYPKKVGKRIPLNKSVDNPDVTTAKDQNYSTFVPNRCLISSNYYYRWKKRRRSHRK